MPSASLTIKIGGTFDGKAIKQAERSMRSLQQQAALAAGGIGGKLVAAGQSMTRFGIAAQKAGAKIQAAGKTMTKMAAPIALLGVAAVKSFQDVEKGEDALIKATGATGKQAEELTKAYKNAAVNVTGSFEEIGAAAGELNTRLDLNGTALEKATEQTQKFAKVNGIDSAQAVKSVSKLMNEAGIESKDYGKVLDELTVAGQKSGISVETLADSVTRNAANMREMGFSTEESIAMLAQFEKSGANTSQILAAMKIGVANWAKEGKSAKDGFAEFVKGVKDGSLTSADAIEQFGSRGGIAMYDAAKSGKLDFQDMFAAITGQSSGALDKVYDDTLTLGDRFDILKKKAEVAFSGFGKTVVDAAIPAIESLGKFLDRAAKKFESLDEKTKKNIVKFGALAIAAGPVVTLVGKLVSGVGLLAMKMGNAVTTIGTMVSGMKGAGAAAGTFSTALKGLAAGVAVIAIGALVTVIKKYLDHVKMVSDATTGLTMATDAMNAAYQGFNPTAQTMTGRLADMSSKANEALQSQADLANSMKSEWESVGTDAAIVDMYASKIEELTSKSKLSETEQAQLAAAVQGFNEKTGSTIEVVDGATGKLSISTEEIKKNADAWKENARAQAATNQLTKLMEQQIENELALEEATRALKEAEDELANSSNKSGAEIQEAQGKVDAAQAKVDELTAAVESNEEAQNDLLAIMGDTGDAADDMGGSMEGAAKKTGDAAKNMSKGMEGGSKNVGSVMAKMVKDINVKLDSAKGPARKSGSDSIAAFASGIDSVKGRVASASTAVANSSTNPMKGLPGTFQNLGSGAGAGFSTGLLAKRGAALSSAGSVSAGALTGLQSLKAKTEAEGKTASTRFATGVGSVSAYAKGQSVANTAKSGMGSVSSWQTGRDFTQGFINGMNSLLSSVTSAAINIGKKAVKGTKTGIDSGSPSREAYKLGAFYDQGLILGMKSLEKDVGRQGVILADAMMAAPEPSVTANGATGRYRGSRGVVNNITVNLYYSAGADANQMASDLADALGRKLLMEA